MRKTPIRNRPVKLAQTLKQARVDAGMSQSKVSGLVGYSNPQYLSNIERGVCPPSLTVLAKLVKLYKLDGQQIIQGLMDEYEKELRTQILGSAKRKPRKKTCTN